MSDAQTWRISQLEKEIEELKDQIDALHTLRDQLMGMGAAASWGVRILVLLGGWGAIDGIARLMHWLNGPLR